MNASRLAAAKAKSPCHEIAAQELAAGDYSLDYDQEALGEAGDPCEEAVRQAGEVAAAEAVEAAAAAAAAQKEIVAASIAQGAAVVQAAGILCKASFRVFIMIH